MADSTAAMMHGRPERQEEPEKLDEEEGEWRVVPGAVEDDSLTTKPLERLGSSVCESHCRVHPVLLLALEIAVPGSSDVSRVAATGGAAPLAAGETRRETFPGRKGSPRSRPSCRLFRNGEKKNDRQRHFSRRSKRSSIVTNDKRKLKRPQMTKGRALKWKMKTKSKARATVTVPPVPQRGVLLSGGTRECRRTPKASS